MGWLAPPWEYGATKGGLLVDSIWGYAELGSHANMHGTRAPGIVSMSSCSLHKDVCALGRAAAGRGFAGCPACWRPNEQRVSGGSAPRSLWARRGALPAASPALGVWRNRAPLLVLGSHAWNAPNKAGRLACGPERQARILQGAARGCVGQGFKVGFGVQGTAAGCCRAGCVGRVIWRFLSMRLPAGCMQHVLLLRMAPVV